MDTVEPLDKQRLQELIDLGRERKRAKLVTIGPWEYLRFDGKVREVPEGAVIFGGEVIWGYPKIGRILQLDTGLKAQFGDNAFYVEEKIDGYNVRIFRHGPDVLAVTRRGYICPFTTDRRPDFITDRFFEEHPDLVLCVEVAGPDNPYNEGSPPFIQEDIGYYVFDVLTKNDRRCLPYRTKLELLQEYQLPSVQRFGRHSPDDAAKLKALMLQLDREGREGIVLKEDSQRDLRIKYVTARTNISDIRIGDSAIRQLPAEYFMHRILRLALFLEEHDLEITPALQRDLGDSLLEGIVETVGQYRRTGEVAHTFRCRFRQRANAELMIRDMGRRLGKRQMRQRRLERVDGYWLLEFDKVLPRTSDLLRHLLNGGLLFD